ncbi:MAG TPA: hypothetical protein DCF42_07945 [Lachnospiraceae bacterium]|nr:hypothetical protein [Lachnospiraceae bacterium]
MLFMYYRYIYTGIITVLTFICTACSGPSHGVLLSESRSELSEWSSSGEETDPVLQKKSDSLQNGIYVYVCGAVRHPGVYQLPGGSRLYEAVDRAGGFTRKADRESVNLAEEVSDGAMVRIPAKPADSRQTDGSGGTGADQSRKAASSGSADLININTADAEKLMTLPGIGENKASAIVRYRETNGRFGRKEDLMNVPGIKEGTFSKFKDQITV